MSAVAELMQTARAAGVTLWLNGDRVRVHAAKPLPPALVAELKAHKTEVLAELKTRGCDETGLQVRCFDACRGLPILPMALFASLTDDDRAAQYSGAEGPDVLRAYALAIADRLKRDDEAAAERLAKREAIGTEAGEPLRTTCPVFRFKPAWNPDVWHYFLAPAGRRAYRRAGDAQAQARRGAFVDRDLQARRLSGRGAGMSGKRSRNKGKTGERELAGFLSAEGFQAVRGVQYHGGANSPDIRCPCLPGIHFEVKRTERLRLYEALSQARRDGAGKLPIVAHRANDSPWVAIMDFTDLLAILRASDYVAAKV